MSAIPPTVRYLILCEDIQSDPSSPNQVCLYNLVSTIRTRAQPPFPVTHPELCVFLELAECRGPGTCRVDIVQADTEAVVFQTRERVVAFPTDPLEVSGLSFRLRGCTFPEAGLYWVRFWYNDVMLARQSLLLRG